MDPDEEELFGWDVDRPWVWAADADDGWVLDLPEGAWALLDSAAARGGCADEWLPRVFELEIGDDETTTTLGHPEIADLLTTAGGRLERCCARGAPVLGDDDLAVISQSAWLICLLLTAASQPADDDAPPRADLTREADVLARLSDECDRVTLMRVRPKLDGTFRLRWRASDRALVAETAAELRRLLETPGDHPDGARLFPSAYANDADRNAEWSALTHDELADRRLASIEVLDRLLSQATASEDEMLSLVQALNSIRLMLGTRIGASEDMDYRYRRGDDSDVGRYEALGLMQYEVVSALRTALP